MLVASVVDVVVFCPSLAAGLVRVSAAVLVALARVVLCAPSPAVTGPRTVQACPYPSPRGWFCASQGESSGCRPAISARARM